jgi:hypothetical protein
MKLLVETGSYEASTLVALLWEVVKHRTWHLFHGEGWVD